MNTSSSLLNRVSDTVNYIEQLLHADRVLLLENDTDGCTLVALLQQVSHWV